MLNFHFNVTLIHCLMGAIPVQMILVNASFKRFFFLFWLKNQTVAGPAIGKVLASRAGSAVSALSSSY